MTPYDMGRISAFLILHRKLEDRSDKRGMRPDEKSLAPSCGRLRSTSCATSKT